MVGAILGGFWAENIVNNTKIAQSAVWLPVHMGNVGLAIVLKIARTAANHRARLARQEGTSLRQSLDQPLFGDFPTCPSRTAPIG